jgi:poly(hydroxyalkanoate) depolymerase family esterase
MFKAFSRMWLQSVKQVSKTQQRQTRKLVKTLLATPTKPRAKSAPKALARDLVQRRGAAISKSTNIGQASQRQLPGKWMYSWYSSFPDDLTMPARRMSYWLYVPQRESTAGLPLVVMLHGCDQTAAQFAQGTRMNRLAEEKGFMVLYPQQSLRAHAQRCWPWYEKQVQAGGGEVQLIAGVINEVSRRYAVDATRVYIGGLSAGAAMAHIVALTFPQRIAAVGLHSGPVFGAGHTRIGAYAVMQAGSYSAGRSAMEQVHAGSGTSLGMPAILVHGQADRVVRHINQTQLVRQFATLNQLGPEHAALLVHRPAGRSKAHPRNAYRIQDYRVGRKLLLRVCDIDLLEHAWSGGDSALKFNEHSGPDASKMMWDFFARHRRPGATAVPRLPFNY